MLKRRTVSRSPPEMGGPLKNNRRSSQNAYEAVSVTGATDENPEGR